MCNKRYLNLGSTQAHWHGHTAPPVPLQLTPGSLAPGRGSEADPAAEPGASGLQPADRSHPAGGIDVLGGRVPRRQAVLSAWHSDRGRSLTTWGLALATPFHMGGSCLKRAAVLTPEPPCLLDRRPAPTWYWTKGLALLPQTFTLQPGQKGGGASQLLAAGKAHMQGRQVGVRKRGLEGRPCGRVRVGDGCRLAGLPTVRARRAPESLWSSPHRSEGKRPKREVVLCS